MAERTEQTAPPHTQPRRGRTPPAASDRPHPALRWSPGRRSSACTRGRWLAGGRRGSRRGTVIGVDHDQTAVDAASERTANQDTVTVQLGDIHDLPLADRATDRARTDRVLQHVADPVRALCEIRRVLQPGGRLVMGEPDWTTLAVDHPDSDLSRAYTQYARYKGRLPAQHFPPP
ncbi:methyltransferase domain-containing protein [Streptomyces sp. NPDC058000]|uniref:methyltransferase domain-containing protein n=1 Tax=Streptomyces sp. NPDC058000 TaxID=3346299 RepID=UPI0036F009B4